MKFTVLLAFGLCVVLLPDVSESADNKSDELAKLCAVEFRRVYPHYKKRWGHLYGYYSRPRHRVRTLKKSVIPSSCKNVKCPHSELCHLIRPQGCQVHRCPLVPICVKQDQSGEWIDSVESEGDGQGDTWDELDRLNDSKHLTDRKPTPILQPMDAVTFDQERSGVATVPTDYTNIGGPLISVRPGNINTFDGPEGPFWNPGGPSIPVENAAIPNPVNIETTAALEDYVDPGGPLIPAESGNLNTFAVPYVNPEGPSIPEEDAVIQNPARFEALEDPRGYVNPGGPVISAQPENANSFNAPEGPFFNPEGPLIPARLGSAEIIDVPEGRSIVNPEGPLTPAKSVSDNNSKVFVDSLKLNNSENFGASRRTDYSEHRDNQYDSNFRIPSVPGPGIYKEDYKIYKTLVNPRTRRHRGGHKRTPFNLGPSELRPYDTFAADSSFETSQALLRRVHRDK